MKKVYGALILLQVASLALLCGCQTGAPKRSDADMAKDTVVKWQQLVPKKDLVAIMSVYSEKFESDEYGDKAGLKSFLKDAIDNTYLDNAQADVSRGQMKVENGVAKFYPIELSGQFGAATIELRLMKEKDAWLITGMRVELH